MAEQSAIFIRGGKLKDLKIEYEATDSLVPYVNNANIHSEEQIEQIVASIKEFGFNDPVGVWTNANGESELVEGHGRVLAAKQLGIDKLPVVHLDSLTDEQRRAYVHVHNQQTRNSEFDLEMLNEEMNELDFNWDELGFEFFEDDDSESLLKENKSVEIGTVIYEPNETNHDIEDLYSVDREYLDEIISEIKNSKVREMLELRRKLFVTWNYSKLADYYAYQATKQEQAAFEALGLVLLDKDQLIENGFSDLIGMQIDFEE